MGEAQAGESLTPTRVFTVGHSTHDLSTFVELLTHHGVACLIDVRITPKSRRFPHFDLENLAEKLPRGKIDYVHMKELGGRRNPLPTSANTAWDVDAFRGYADYMSSDEFNSALARLEALASENPTAYMCAEGLWWRCHRRLISDALVVRDWDVQHILPPIGTNGPNGPDEKLEPHALTEFALVEGTHITYPNSQGKLEL